MSSLMQKIPIHEDEFHQIPEEIIITNILSRLPSKSLLRFRCVCKSWNFLITHDLDFRALHLKHSNLHKDPNSLSWFSFNPVLSPNNPSPAKTIFWLNATSFSYCEPVPFEAPQLFRSTRIISSCNGIICFIVETFFEQPYICLYNPSIRRSRTINLPPIKYCMEDGYVLGFGYVERSNDYKIVMIREEGFEECVYVYSLKRGSWTEMAMYAGISTRSIWRASKCGTYYDGACYWAYRRVYDGFFVILCFHLDEQTFEFLKPPGSYTSNTTQYGVLHHFSIVIYKNMLTLSSIRYSCGPTSRDCSWEMWTMMQKENGVVSDSWTWTLLFKVKIEFMLLPSVVLVSDSDDRVMLLDDDISKNVLLAYDPQSQKFEELKLPNYTHQLVHFKESLVML